MKRITLNRYRWVTNRATCKRELKKDKVLVNSSSTLYLDFKQKPESFSDYWFEYSCDYKLLTYFKLSCEKFDFQGAKNLLGSIYYLIRIIKEFALVS